MIRNLICIFSTLLITGSLTASDPDYFIFSYKKTGGPVNAAIFSPDDSKIVFGGDDHVVRIIDLEKNDLLLELSGHFRAIHDLLYTKDGTSLLSAGDRSIRIWDPESGEEKDILTGPVTDIWSLDVNSNFTKVVAGSFEKKFRVWDMTKPEKEREQIVDGHSKSCLAVALSPNGKIIASGSLDQTIKLWNASDLTEITTIKAHGGNILDLCFSPDGTSLASASLDKTIKIWDVATGKIKKVLSGHESGVLSIDYSPDGKNLLSSSADMTVKLWEPGNGNCLYTFVYHDGPVNSVRYNHSGDKFVCSSMDESISVWNIDPSIFVNGYFEAEINQEIDDSPLFDDRKKEESRDEYQQRQLDAENFKKELFEKYYQKYLEIRSKQN